MPQTITCVELHSDEWARLRDIRLRALLDSPHAFGGTYENESNFDESRWHIEFAKQTFLVFPLAASTNFPSMKICDWGFRSSARVCQVFVSDMPQMLSGQS